MKLFTQQTFSIFILLAVAWGPNSGLCCKSVILTSAIKIRIKTFMLFTQQALPIFIPFAVTWGPNLGPCCKSVILASAIKINIKFVYAFLPKRHFPCSPPPPFTVFFFGGGGAGPPYPISPTQCQCFDLWFALPKTLRFSNTFHTKTSILSVCARHSISKFRFYHQELQFCNTFNTKTSIY